jgi:hypothetical protein
VVQKSAFWCWKWRSWLCVSRDQWYCDHYFQRVSPNFCEKWRSSWKPMLRSFFCVQSWCNLSRKCSLFGENNHDFFSKAKSLAYMTDLCYLEEPQVRPKVVGKWKFSFVTLSIEYSFYTNGPVQIRGWLAEGRSQHPKAKNRIVENHWEPRKEDLCAICCLADEGQRVAPVSCQELSSIFLITGFASYLIKFVDIVQT